LDLLYFLVDILIESSTKKTYFSYNQTKYTVNTVAFLIRVCKSAHAAHDTQHVVVHCVHTHLGSQAGTNSVVGQDQVQGGVVDTGEVAGAAGLVVLRLQGEAVDVHTHCRDVGVVLVRLDQVEVLALTLGEPIVTVQLDLGQNHRVLTGQALHAGHAVTGLQHGAIPPVGVVEGLLTLPGVHDVIGTAQVAVTLHNPNQLLTRVVEVQLQLVGAGGHALSTSELQLLDQVLVGDLGEAATLISIQVDVVHVQGGGHQASVGHAITDHVGVGGTGVGVVPAQVTQLVELEPDLHLVVLQGDQRQSQTRVAAEPELQRDVQSVLRSTLTHLAGGVGLDVAAAIGIAVLTTLHQQVHQLRHVAHHLGVAALLAGLLGQLVPDVQPVTVVLVDLLTANLQVHVVDQVVTHPVQPAELCTAAVSALQLHLRQGALQVHTVDQIAVTADGALHLLAEVGGSVEGLLNGLHGEVSVATVHNLEDKFEVPSLSGYFVHVAWNRRFQ
jgi:hypothetical protein